MSYRRPGRLPWVRLLSAGLALAAVAGCRPEDQRTDSLDPQGSQTRAELPPELVTRLDSGTLAFREDDMEAALRHYEAAAEMAPDHAAGWFGVYMVQRRLGNADAAEEALERAQTAAPGATILHPTAADTVP